MREGSKPFNKSLETMTTVLKSTSLECIKLLLDWDDIVLIIINFIVILLILIIRPIGNTMIAD